MGGDGNKWVGVGKSLKVNKRGVAISGGGGGLEKLHIFSRVLW